ncbi:MAG: lpxH 1, partial [Mucilaginibacter sp.]|nr:lpxH 1 [Mucilaginibacter sp.]
EYHNGNWDIFKYHPDNFKSDVDEDDKTDAEDLDAKLDVNLLLERFKQEAH